MSKTEEKSGVGILAPATGEKPAWWVPLGETLVAVIIVAAILYWHGDRKFEMEAILVAVLPVLFWLLLSGRLTSFKAFGVELSAAIKQVSSEGIRKGPTPMASGTIEFEPIQAVSKEDPGKIKEYIARKVRALSFELRKRDYYKEDVIRMYLDELCPYRFFKWIVFKYPDGQFGGLVPAQNLHAFGASQDPEKGYHSIVQRIENERIHDLPGFVGREQALSASASKGEAIERFGKTDLDELPVVNRDGTFVGILNRGQLFSSVLSSIIDAAHARS
jgi:hypothetical protein